MFLCSLLYFTWIQHFLCYCPLTSPHVISQLLSGLLNATLNVQADNLAAAVTIAAMLQSNLDSASAAAYNIAVTTNSVLGGYGYFEVSSASQASQLYASCIDLAAEATYSFAISRYPADPFSSTPPSPTQR